MTRQRDVKKSNFTTSTTLDDGAFLDFVINGQNYKISKASFLAAIGTFGSLVQKGEVAGIPVLNTVGTVNYIRNIVAESGILAALSPEGGVQLDHNFTQDTTGVPVLSNPTAASPTIRSLTAGTGISVAAQNGNIQIALSATPVSNKTVIINELTDFPTAVAGVITLADDTNYFITNDITTSSRFVLGEDTVVSATDGSLITLSYTGSGTMFTSTSYSNKIKDIICSCTSGTFCEITGTLGTEFFQVTNARVICDEIGTIDTVYIAAFDSVVWEVATDGITFLNNTSIISFFQNVGGISAGTFLDLGTSTFDGFSFSNSFGTIAAGATFISGLADSGNVNTDGFATVLNIRALGSGTALNNIAVSDSLWQFRDNSGIPDSIDSLLALNGGGLVTIAAVDTPVIIGATWTYDHESRFEGTAGGRFTYTGKGANISINASISAIGVVPTARDFEFLIYKNGVAVANAVFSRSFNNGGDGSLSIVWQEDLSTDDYLELFVQNTTNGDNILINSVQLGIS